eukprot:454671_1
MGVCAVGVPAPTVPQIDVDEVQLKNLIQTEMEKIQDLVRDNCERFPDEIAKADPKPFSVPHTSIKLNKDTSEQEIAMAAIRSAFGKQTRDKIKTSIWNQLEPQIDVQLEQNQEVSEKAKLNEKNKFKRDTVNKLVDDAMDEALAQMERK